MNFIDMCLRVSSFDFQGWEHWKKLQRLLPAVAIVPREM